MAEAVPPARPDPPGAEVKHSLPRPPLLNVANVLTGVRLLLVPLFAVALISSDGRSLPLRLTATLLFAVASVTDLYDGRIARARNLVTPFGEVADPIADKALTGAALIGLSVVHRLPWWVTIVILVREVGVTVLRFWVLRYGVIAASRGGKLKTLLQVAAIFWYLFPWLGPLAVLRPILMGAALVITVVTGGDYLYRALALRRPARTGGGVPKSAPPRAAPEPGPEGPEGPTDGRQR